MGVKIDKLAGLGDPMESKYRVQSTKYSKSTILSYIDSRQVQNRLDEICGPENWQNDFRIIGNELYGGIGINILKDEKTGLSEWVWKWDVGVESSAEKEKGNASDSFKRAAIHWNIGRFLYSLGVITLNTKAHTNGKEYPSTKDGKILWTSEELNDYCKSLKERGILDDTKPTKKVDDSKKPVSKASPKKEESIEDETWRSKAIEKISLLDQAPILKHILTELKVTKTVEQYVQTATKEQVYALYNKFHIPETK